MAVVDWTSYGISFLSGLGSLLLLVEFVRRPGGELLFLKKEKIAAAHSIYFSFVCLKV
jgi:hypothetical protein